MVTPSKLILRSQFRPSREHSRANVSWQSRAWILAGFAFSITSLAMFFKPWVTTDFDEYHRAAVRVSQGETPYRLDELGTWHCYRYPPAFAYLMIPSGYLDVAWAGRIWFVCNWLMLAG